MRRRQFIAGLGSAAAWPVVAGAQGGRVRRIGVLLAYDENDSEAKIWLSGFKEELAKLGWTESRNVQMDVRWAAANVDRMRMFARELVDLQPDVILAHGTPVTRALQRETRTIPITFVAVADPVGEGIIVSLPHPGGNLTGFVNLEGSVAGKWLQLLTEISPGLKRVAMMFNPDTAPGGGSYYVPAFETAARSLKVEPIVAPVYNDNEIEEFMTSLGRKPGGGLVVMSDNFMLVHRAPIILLAARNNVPAVYPWKYAVAEDGGLLSYGPDLGDIYRRAAPYVDRILRGAKPSDLPVQLPVKFEMAVNVKAAKALDLTVPQSILLSADEVIE